MSFKTVFTDEELLPVLPEGLSLAKYSEEDLQNLTKSGDFLPRLQLMTSASQPCKDGKFAVNHWAFIEGSDTLDLGEEVDVLVVTWRPKAIEMGDGSVVSSYDPQSETFKKIQEKSFEANSGCMFGPEYLVWIPGIKEWAGYFMGSKTARNESKSMAARLKKPATLKSRKIKNGQFTWFGPVVVACSTPFEMPTAEDVVEQVNKFNNPPVSTAVLAEPADGDNRDR